jgi:ATP-dependent Lon protease
MNPPAKTLTLPAIPIRDMVLFPGGRLPFLVGRRASVRTMELAVKTGDHLVMLTQRDPREEEPKQESLHPMGTLALVESLLSVPRDHYKVGVRGIARVRLERYLDDGDVVQAEVTILNEPSTPETALLPTFHEAVAGLLARNPEVARILTLAQVQELPLGAAIDTVAAALPVEVRDKQQVLEQAEIEPRLHTLLKLLEQDAARHQLEGEGEAKPESSAEHKAFVLGEKAPNVPPGGRRGEKDEFARLRERIQKAEMGEEAEKKALEELERLEAMPPQSAESTVSRGYIDWLLALPWKTYADEHLDLDEAERVLDEDHSGLEKVKTRILEYLAVMRRLRDSGARSGSRPGLRGPILCLVGPPGVGKTSLARSIARALNRPFLRFSLGGVRDEAEIRGHRRTYIGSMPGRIISLLKKGGVRNPLILLDEIDKMGADWRGDPSSALLEVLDPEQNFAFQDHYLDVGFDLSQVLFLATANVRHQIPQPLEDRLEILELSSYTLREKRAIAQAHLVPKALERHGMENMGIGFDDAAVDKIIQDYTKEAGVRQLEREISAVLRKLARQSLQPERPAAAAVERSGGAAPEPAFDPKVTAERLPRLLGPEIFLETPVGRQPPPGVVNGMAWTPFGGDLLTIEAARLPGKGNLKLTGKLGEVMQESANLALSFVRMRADSLGLKSDFLEQTDLHVHLPEGAIPKDGPSAGITLATALISVLTGIPVRSDLAMTGELTLRGMVLPIGGLKEKLLAADRMGCSTVLIPLENARHLEELPAEVRERLTIHLVAHMDEVIRLALVRPPGPLAAAAPGPGAVPPA